MDWIKKLEEEKRSRQEAELDVDWSRMQSAAKFRDSVAVQLLPIIEDVIAELKERTGIVLRPELYETKIIVSGAPRKGQEMSCGITAFKGFCWMGDHHFIISELSDDGQTVRVKAIEDRRIDRGELPDDMSIADWYGVEKVVCDVRNDLEALVAGEIQLLLEWLVRTETSRESIAPPRISGLLRAEQEKEDREHEEKYARRGAYLALTCGILGFPCGIVFLGPVALFLGIRSYERLSRLGTDDGRVAAGWAMGLGGFASVALLIWIIAMVFQVLARI